MSNDNASLQLHKNLEMGTTTEDLRKTPSFELPKEPAREKPDPKSIKLLLQLLVQAQKVEASRIHIAPGEDSVKFEFFASGPSLQEPKIVHSITSKREIYEALYLTLVDRVFPWPSPGDRWFSVGSSKAKRLLVAPSTEFRVSAELSFKKQPTQGKQTLIIDNIEYVSIAPIIESLSLCERDRSALGGQLRSRTGIVLVNTASKANTISGGAVVLAMRPDAVYYADASRSELLRDAVRNAETQLVVAALESSDPVELIFTAAGILAKDKDCAEALVQHLRLSFTHNTVRRVCSACARSTPVTPETIERLPKSLRPEGKVNYMFGRGCNSCGHAAYRGAIGIASVLPIDDQIRELIAGSAQAAQVTELAYRRGTRSMLEDGLEKIYAGLTSFEEVLGVAGSVSQAFQAAIINHRSTGGETAKDVEIHEKFSALEDNFFISEGDAPTPVKLDRLETSDIQTVSKCLLVVEDDHDQRQVLELIFRSAGYEVVGAADGEEALGTMNKRRIDLVVCDVAMPVMNGMQFVERLRQNSFHRGIPVLMLTAVSDPDTEYNLLAAGADDFCDKNVAKKILLKRIERLLQRKRRNPLEHMLAD